jgi:tripartite-type tricarboxylate transporter receptor subunit TctC
MGRVRAATLIASVASGVIVVQAANAQTPEQFYKGKTVEMQVGYSAGGGYDVYARAVARYLGRHIPGQPNVIVKNSPGAGSLKLTNWLYIAGPKDGTSIGAIARGAPFDPLLGNKAAKFDARKFTYIGSANDEVSVCVSWKGTGIKTIEDLKQKELVIGGTGKTADTDQFPKVLNEVLGTKMKVVTGYPGGNDINVAMERGEVKGRCGWSWSSVITTRPQWYKDGTINVLVQLALSKHPDLPNVPLVMDLAKTDTERKMLRLVFARQTMGRPFVAPPGVPADRAAALRKAFMDTMKDKEFLAEAAKTKLEIVPVSGEALQKLVDETYDVDPAIAARVAKAIN